MKTLELPIIGYILLNKICESLIKLSKFIFGKKSNGYTSVEVIESEVVKWSEDTLTISFRSYESGQHQKSELIDFKLKQNNSGSYCAGVIHSTGKEVYLKLTKKILQLSQKDADDIAFAIRAIGIKIPK